MYPALKKKVWWFYEQELQVQSRDIKKDTVKTICDGHCKVDKLAAILLDSGRVLLFLNIVQA